MKPHSSLSEGKARLIIDSIEGWQEQAGCHHRMAQHEAERGNLGSSVVQTRKAREAEAVALALFFELFDGKHRCACCCLPEPASGHKRDGQFEQRAQELWNRLLEQANKEIERTAEVDKRFCIFPPWTPQQVDLLNEYQAAAVFDMENGGLVFAPITGLGNEVKGPPLIATKDGWVAKEGGPVVCQVAPKWVLEFFEPKQRAEKVYAPWTEEQVATLNRYQTEGCMHPFTGERGLNGEETVLIATRDGWIECEDGPVVQAWAWRWMTDGTKES